MKEEDKKMEEYLQLATEQGDPKAQYNLGVCYDKGDDVSQGLAEV